MDFSDEEYQYFLRRVRAEYETDGLYQYAQKFGIPYADLRKFRPEPNALRLLPRALAERHNVLPLRHQGTVLFLAISDPNNQPAMDDVRLACRCTIKPVLAAPDDIRTYITKCYTGLETEADK